MEEEIVFCYRGGDGSLGDDEGQHIAAAATSATRLLLVFNTRPRHVAMCICSGLDYYPFWEALGFSTSILSSVSVLPGWFTAAAVFISGSLWMQHGGRS